MICPVVHPDRQDVSCDKELPCSGYHANALQGLVWPHENGLPVPQAPVAVRGRRTATSKADIAVIAQRAERSRQTRGF